MSKHLKDLLICLLSITILILGCVGVYYYYKETQRKEEWEKLWRNEFATQNYRKTINPYQVKEKIYFYYATEYDHDKRMKNYCRIDVYSLNEQPPIQDLKVHLNYYDETLDDTDNIVENQEKGMITLLGSNEENNIAIHSWIYNHQISKEIFNDYISNSGYKQSIYDKYLECLSFIEDIPHKNSIFAKTGVKVYVENVKYPDIDTIDLDKNISSIINNPNALVKIEVFDSGIVYFYDTNKKFLISLKFQPKI